MHEIVEIDNRLTTSSLKECQSNVHQQSGNLLSALANPGIKLRLVMGLLLSIADRPCNNARLHS